MTMPHRNDKAGIWTLSDLFLFIFFIDSPYCSLTIHIAFKELEHVKQQEATLQCTKSIFCIGVDANTVGYQLSFLV